MEIQSVHFYRAAYEPEHFPRDQRPQFAIVGRSNVGKSSFINSILRRRGLARVSQTPGKTQAVQFYLLNDKVYLVDLPGYGYAKVPRAITASWGTLVRSYLESSSGAIRLLFLLVDGRRIPSEHDLSMRDWMIEAGIRWKVVLTKVDKLSGNELARSRRAIAGKLDVAAADLIDFSSVTRQGTERIWREIDERLRS
ncbi:MAG TPA: ribosome biogenesis GTP-binding protein YihA/YsxC [Thermoanaerobaculia bacterium]|nr:ribosome biogenesis GTP-binding protein YihA/YsxC [Thermoanaerobaculia bacterium]